MIINGKLEVVAGRTTRNLEAIAPDGTVLTYRTSADRDLAGLTRNRGGEWKIAVVGSSPSSVRSRTRRIGAGEWEVVALSDPAFRVPQLIKDYFADDASRAVFRQTPQITSAFIPGTGWVALVRPVPAVFRYLRIIKRAGATSIGVTAYNRTPDFTIDELLKVNRAPLLGGALIGSKTKNKS